MARALAMIRALMALTFIGYGANVGAQSREPTGVVRLDVGPTTTRLTVRVMASATVPSAAAAVGNGSLTYGFACERLKGLTLGTRPLCDWLDDTSSAERHWEAKVVRDRLDLTESIGLPTSNILTIDGERRPELRLRVDPEAIPPTLLLVEARQGLILDNAHPLPSDFSSARLRYLIGNIRRPSPVTVRIGIGEGRVHPDVDAALRRGPPSVADALSSRTRRGLAEQLGRLTRELGHTIAALLPLLAVLGLLTARPREGAGSATRRAASLCLILAALVPLGSLARSAHVSEIFGHSPYHFIFDQLYSTGSGESPRRASRIANTVVDFAGIAAGFIVEIVLLAAIAWAAAAILRRFGWDPPVRSRAALGLAALLLLLAVVPAHIVGLAEIAIVEHSPAWPYQLYAALALAPVAAFIAAAAGHAAALAGRRLTFAGGALAALVALVLLVPWDPAVHTYSLTYRPAGVDVITPMLTTSGFYLASVASLALVVPLLGLLHQQRRPITDGGPDGFALGAGALLFALAAGGPAAAPWAGVASFLIALLIAWPRLVIAPAAQRTARERLRIDDVDLKAWVERLERAADLNSAARGSALNAKLGEGALTPSEWGRKRAALENARDSAVDAALIEGVPARDLVLGVSLTPDPWRSGIRGLIAGLPVIVLLTMLVVMRGGAPSDPSQPLIFWAANFLQAAVPLGAVAFAFGYFFDALRGSTGLHKALIFGAALALAETPAWLGGFADGRVFVAMVWSVSQHFLLLLSIAIFGFDYARMRQIEGQRFDWRRFSWFGDSRLISTGIAASVAAVAPALATIFSGPFAEAVKSMGTIMAPVLPVN